MTQAMCEAFEEICQFAVAVKGTDWHSTVNRTIGLARDVRDTLHNIASSLENIANSLNYMNTK